MGRSEYPPGFSRQWAGTPRTRLVAGETGGVRDAVLPVVVEQSVGDRPVIRPFVSG
jgi:hypothetical protein